MAAIALSTVGSVIVVTGCIVFWCRACGGKVKIVPVQHVHQPAPPVSIGRFNRHVSADFGIPPSTNIGSANQFPVPIH
jgi:hypothetical protein